MRPSSSLGRHVPRPISREAQTVNKRRFAIAIGGGDDVAVLPGPLTRNAAAAAGCATSVVIHRFPPGREWHSWNLSGADLLVDIEVERRSHRVTDGRRTTVLAYTIWSFFAGFI